MDLSQPDAVADPRLLRRRRRCSYRDRATSGPTWRCAACCRSRRSARSRCPRRTPVGWTRSEMRRLGQIDVRPAPSELMTNLPRAIVIFGWLAVALRLRHVGAVLRRRGRAAVGVGRGGARRRAGGRPRRGDGPRDPLVLRRFGRYRGAVASLPAERTADAERQSIARGRRAGQPRPGVRRRPAAPGRRGRRAGRGGRRERRSGSASRSTRRRSSTSCCRSTTGRSSGWTTHSPTCRRRGAEQPGVLAAARRPHRPVGAGVGRRARRRRRCTSSSTASAWPPSSGAGCKRSSDSIRPCGRCATSRPKYGSQIESSFGELGARLGVAPPRRPAVAGDRGDDPARRRLVPGHLDHPVSRPRRRRRRTSWCGRRWFVPGVELLPAQTCRSSATPSSARTCSPVPRDPRLPAPGPPPEDLQHRRRADPRRLRAGAGGQRRVHRARRRGADVLRRLHAAERARVAAGEGRRQGRDLRSTSRSTSRHR